MVQNRGMQYLLFMFVSILSTVESASRKIPMVLMFSHTAGSGQHLGSSGVIL